MMARREEAVLRNRARTPREYYDNLMEIVRRSVSEDMSNDDWAICMGWSGELLLEQPNGGELRDDEDPFFQEKKKAYAACLRNAAHIRRPSSFRPRTYDPPEDDLPSATGSTRLDLDPPEDDLPGRGSTRPDHGRDGLSSEATSPAIEDAPPSPAIEVSPVVVPRPPSAKKGKGRTKKSVSFGDGVIGSRPMRPTVAPLANLPAKKDLFLGGVSTKK